MAGGAGPATQTTRVAQRAQSPQATNVRARTGGNMSTSQSGPSAYTPPAGPYQGQRTPAGWQGGTPSVNRVYPLQARSGANATAFGASVGMGAQSRGGISASPPPPAHGLPVPREDLGPNRFQRGTNAYRDSVYDYQEGRYSEDPDSLWLKRASNTGITPVDPRANGVMSRIPGGGGVFSFVPGAGASSGGPAGGTPGTEPARPQSFAEAAAQAQEQADARARDYWTRQYEARKAAEQYTRSDAVSTTQQGLASEPEHQETFEEALQRGSKQQETYRQNMAAAQQKDVDAFIKSMGGFENRAAEAFGLTPEELQELTDQGWTIDTKKAGKAEAFYGEEDGSFQLHGPNGETYGSSAADQALIRGALSGSRQNAAAEAEGDELDEARGVARDALRDQLGVQGPRIDEATLARREALNRAMGAQASSRGLRAQLEYQNQAGAGAAGMGPAPAQAYQSGALGAEATNTAMRMQADLANLQSEMADRGRDIAILDRLLAEASNEEEAHLARGMQAEMIRAQMQAQADMQAAQARMQQQQSDQSMWGTIASIGGTLLGGVLGGPIGAGIGGALGGGLGAGIGSAASSISAPGVWQNPTQHRPYSYGNGYSGYNYAGGYGPGAYD